MPKSKPVAGDPPQPTPSIRRHTFVVVVSIDDNEFDPGHDPLKPPVPQAEIVLTMLQAVRHVRGFLGAETSIVPPTDTVH